MLACLFNSLRFNEFYDYQKLGPITLIFYYTRNNRFLVLKNKFGTILCVSCGLIERTTTRKKRAVSTFLALVSYLINLCKQKKVRVIHSIVFNQTSLRTYGLFNRKLQKISYLFYINKIRINRFRFIIKKPHHLGKKKRRFRRK